MNLPKSKEEIIAMTAEECGVSRQVVIYVIKKFELALRYFMSNPAKSKGRILINGFFTIAFKEKRARNAMWIMRGIKPDDRALAAYEEYFKDKNVELDESTKQYIDEQINRRVRKSRVSERRKAEILRTWREVNCPWISTESDGHGSEELPGELGQEGAGYQGVQ